MSFRDPPRSTAWRHRDARDGFEVVFVRSDNDGYRLEGGTTAAEDGVVWIVDYVIILGAGWLTRGVVISGRSAPAATALRSA